MPSPGTIKSTVSTQTRAPLLMGLVEMIFAVVNVIFCVCSLTTLAAFVSSSGFEVLSKTPSVPSSRASRTSLASSAVVTSAISLLLPRPFAIKFSRGITRQSKTVNDDVINAEFGRFYSCVLVFFAFDSNFKDDFFILAFELRDFFLV